MNVEEFNLLLFIEDYLRELSYNYIIFDFVNGILYLRQITEAFKIVEILIHFCIKKSRDKHSAFW